jgi:exopolysaccharide production protein ExoZ
MQSEMEVVESSVLNPNLTSRSKLLSLQAARGVAALMVLAYHASGYVAGSGLWPGSKLQHTFQGGFLGVQLFFVLSGFVILSAHWKDLGRQSRLARFFSKRFFRIYPIYWVILAITFAQHHHSYNPSDPKMNHWVILSSFLLVHVHSTNRLVDVSWTLFHEIVFYAFFSLAILWRRVGLGIMAVWLIGSVIFSSSPFERFLPEIFYPDHLLFGFGMAAAWLLSRQWNLPHRLVTAAGMGIFAGVALISISMGLPTYLKLIAGFGAAVLMLGAAAWERAEGLQIPRAAAFLGDASYSIYLVHLPVIWILAKLMKKVGIHHHFPQSVGFLFLALAALTFGIGTYLTIEQPMLLWFKKLKDVKAIAPGAVVPA